VALLDRDRNLIVLRVVYDGPPEAGKTTSLRALGTSLGQPLYTPAEEAGRTLFFDWMDYTGGRFEGYQLRCQIVSVPGQRELLARRRKLLSEADVVVFVADTTASRLSESLAMLRELPRLLAGTAHDDDPLPLGVVLQANKRDRDDAVPLPELREAVRGVTSAAIVESVAADGTGIRESFVLSVRLALDRVREQLRTQRIDVGAPPIDSGPQLFSLMRGIEPERVAPSAAPLVAQVLAENEEPPWRAPDLESALLAATHDPRPPDASAPAGAIWPPVDGRVILHEATSTPLGVRRLKGGGFTAGLGGAFRLYSADDACFSDLDTGRETLVRWARLHVACHAFLSSSRCVVLAATGHGSFRLWQIVRVEPTLRGWLEDVDRLPTHEAALRLVDAATLLADADAAMERAGIALPCSLDTIGRADHRAVYVGLMPMERLATRSAPERELESIVNAIPRRDEVLAALAHAPRGRVVLDQLGR